jgi:hypothetical protein
MWRADKIFRKLKRSRLALKIPPSRTAAAKGPPLRSSFATQFLGENLAELSNLGMAGVGGAHPLQAFDRV